MRVHEYTPGYDLGAVESHDVVRFELVPLRRNPEALRELAQCDAKLIATDVAIDQLGVLARSFLLREARIAEVEKERLSEATKAGMKRARERGQTFGGDRGHVPAEEHREAALAARRAKAREARKAMRPRVAAAYRKGGSYAAAAELLNRAGVPTLSGRGGWHSRTVSKVLAEPSRRV